MAEPAEQLRHALRDLTQALDANTSVDPGVRERLVRAVEEIQAALARLPEEQQSTAISESPDASAADSEDTLAGQLAGVAREFEESHPTLSGMVGSVIDALARMGI